MTISEMKERKREMGLTNEMIAQRSGVPLGTVQKVFAGTTKAPRLETLKALEKVFAESAPQVSYLGQIQERETSMVREGQPLESRRYNLDDYYALPDERRVELIDGVIYDMAAPSPVHQIILLQLHLQLAPCVEQHPECELFVSPCDVRLDNDEWTMVQPDVFIICDRKQMDNRRINGAPEFIIEVLSPSNRTHDLFRKLNKYLFAGVREYWIVDPQNQETLVYDLEHDKFPDKYTFEDTVPVRISEGECSIDFKRIREKIEKAFG